MLTSTMLSMVACYEVNNDKYLLGASPDERLEAQIKEYKDVLVGSPYGWLVAVGTKNLGAKGGAYRLWMKFYPNDRVRMCMDLDNASATTVVESSYRIRAMQYPTLMFDTYNYIHRLADPDPATGLGDPATVTGLQSDYDISLTGNINSDDFTAEGRFNHCPFIFTKADLQDTIDISSGPALVDIQHTVGNLWDPLANPTIDVEGDTIQISVGTRLSIFYSIDNNNFVTATYIPTYADFYQNVRLLTPYKVRDIEFDRLTWNGEAYEVNVKGERYSVFDMPLPFYPLNLGVGNQFTSISVDHNQLNTSNGKSMLAPFLTSYTNAVSQIASMSPTRTMTMSLHFWINEQEQEIMTVKFTTRNTTNTYYHEVWLRVVRENDLLSFKDLVQATSLRGTNMAAICNNTAIRDLLSYFFTSNEDGSNAATVRTSGGTTYSIAASGNKFRLSWAPNNTPELPGNLGALYLVDDNGNPTNSYVPGVLGNVAP
jgi:hypothetical protein